MCAKGDMLALITTCIGPMAIAPISRAWTIGHVRMTNSQRDYYAAAVDQIERNLSVLAPGLSFREFNERSWRIPDKYRARRYAVAVHGVGVADEWPSIPLHTDFANAYDGRFEENMTVCLESLIGEEGGRESVKLETQVLITGKGAKRLDSLPWETI